MKRIVLITSVLALAGCEPTADDKMNQAQEIISNEAATQVGLPAIVNFQEKRMAKMILELRDKAITTYAYVMTLDGHLLKVCDSIGYGLPYATQYTAPQKRERGTSVVLPQADPNGLFSPPQADGTWVMCSDPESKKLWPVFVEPRVIVSPFPLRLQATQ